MTTTFHRHWRDVPKNAWRWPNFSPAEIACRGTGKLLINELALDKLQALRDRLCKPLIVRSAYRSPEHNRTVGGAASSKHLDRAAFDIAMSNHDPVAFEAAAQEAVIALLTAIMASSWMQAALRYGAIVLAVFLFLLSIRRAGERAGRLAERLETTEKINDVQSRMLEAAARRPRDRDELAERLRDGRF